MRDDYLVIARVPPDVPSFLGGAVVNPTTRWACVEIPSALFQRIMRTPGALVPIKEVCPPEAPAMGPRLVR